MKLQATLLLFMAVIATGAIYREIQIEDPENPGKCKIDDDVFVEVGSGYNDTALCASRGCGRGRELGTLMIVTHTCGAVGAGPGCTVVPRSEGIYPDCCPKLSCTPPDV